MELYRQANPNTRVDVKLRSALDAQMMWNNAREHLEPN